MFNKVRNQLADILVTQSVIRHQNDGGYCVQPLYARVQVIHLLSADGFFMCGTTRFDYPRLGQARRIDRLFLHSCIELVIKTGLPSQSLPKTAFLSGHKSYTEQALFNPD